MILQRRAEDRERRRKEALRRVAPGFEPDSGPLVPDRVAQTAGVEGEMGSDATKMHSRERSVMDDLVDHLAALEASGTSTPDSSQPLR